MIKKLTYFLLMLLVPFASFAKEEKVISVPKEGITWVLYASLVEPKAEFYYSDDYIKKVGDGYGREYSYMSSIEVQHIDCKADSYQSKLVKAFRKPGAKEPTFYSEQTKGDWHSSEGNGGQKYLHKIVYT